MFQKSTDSVCSNKRWQAQILPLPDAVSNLFAATAYTETLTLSDRYGLLAALTNYQLSDDERQAIDRLLHAIVKGRFKISTT